MLSSVVNHYCSPAGVVGRDKQKEAVLCKDWKRSSALVPLGQVHSHSLCWLVSAAVMYWTVRVYIIKFFSLSSWFDLFYFPSVFLYVTRKRMKHIKITWQWSSYTFHMPWKWFNAFSLLNHQKRTGHQFCGLFTVDSKLSFDRHISSIQKTSQRRLPCHPLTVATHLLFCSVVALQNPNSFHCLCIVSLLLHKDNCLQRKHMLPPTPHGQSQGHEPQSHHTAVHSQ